MSKSLKIDGHEIMAHDLANDLFHEYVRNPGVYKFSAEFVNDKFLHICYYFKTPRIGGFESVELDINDPHMGRKLIAHIRKNVLHEPDDMFW